MDKKTYIYPDGSKYEGEWKNDKRHGRGVLTRPDGMRYEGEWADGKPNGKGILTSPNGEIKGGMWVKGKFIEEQKPGETKEDSLGELAKSQSAKIQELEEHNQALNKKISSLTSKVDSIERQSDENSLFEENYFAEELKITEEKGSHHNILRTGKEGSKRFNVWWIVPAVLLLLIVFVVANSNGGIGTLYFDDGTTFYKGELRRNVPHGQGTAYHKNGTIMFHGEFKNGEWHQGKVINEEGTIMYIGELKSGMFHGQGKIFRKDGTIMYDGEYRYNEWHGQGTLYQQDGTILHEGEFINSEPIW